MDETFDPALHRRHETRWFEDFAMVSNSCCRAGP